MGVRRDNANGLRRASSIKTAVAAPAEDSDRGKGQIVVVEAIPRAEPDIDQLVLALLMLLESPDLDELLETFAISTKD